MLPLGLGGLAESTLEEVALPARVASLAVPPVLAVELRVVGPPAKALT